MNLTRLLKVLGQGVHKPDLHSVTNQLFNHHMDVAHR